MRTATFALVLCGWLALACGDSTGPEDIFGTYALQTVDGAPSPWLLFAGGSWTTLEGEQVWVETTQEIVSGSLRLNENATFSATHTWRITARVFSATGDEIRTDVTADPRTESGTLTVTRASVGLTYANGAVSTASISGRALTIVTEGVQWVYER